MLKKMVVPKKVTLLIFSIILTAAIYLYSSCTSSVTNYKLAQIQESYLTSESILAVETERQENINKVKNIISRYNADMDDSLKSAIAGEIYVMSKKYQNLNIDFISATITHESAKSWDPQVISRVGAIGLMQIMPATGAYLAIEEGIEWTNEEEILFDPILNIRLGCRYLNELVGMYEKDGGLAAYNGGPKRAEMWIAANRNNKILWKETQKYVPAVLELYERFRTEHKL